ncbi:MAG: hypothetical protein IPM57_08585 [Oligoflexia bacterium]|nr:hypothetical protein [Oligoflexia bacterium]
MSNDEEEKIEKPSIPLVDVAKKLFTVGVSAAFMTEESIRNYVNDLKLPKEVLQFILNSAAKGKEELVQRVGKEISGLISHIDWVKEASKFAESHKFKIEIEIIPKKNNSKSDVSS